MTLDQTQTSVDPGEGWRLLAVDEIIQGDDEFLPLGEPPWERYDCSTLSRWWIGNPVTGAHFPIRRRIPPAPSPGAAERAGVVERMSHKIMLYAGQRQTGAGMMNQYSLEDIIRTELATDAAQADARRLETAIADMAKDCRLIWTILKTQATQPDVRAIALLDLIQATADEALEKQQPTPDAKGEAL